MKSIDISFSKIITKFICDDKNLGYYYNHKFSHSKHTLQNIIHEILFVLQTGISWRNLRSSINYNTIYWHYKRFIKHGIFKKIYSRLLNSYCVSNKDNLYIQIIDTTFIQNKLGKNRIARNKYFRNKNCNKVSIVTDVEGIPLSVLCDIGNKHDLTFCDKHINDLLIIKRKYKLNNKLYMLADKGYTSHKLMDKFNTYNYNLIIPPKKNMKTSTKYDKTKFKNRHVVENTFASLKIMRRIMIRYDSLIKNYIGFLYLGLSKLIFTKL